MAEKWSPWPLAGMIALMSTPVMVYNWLNSGQPPPQRASPIAPEVSDRRLITDPRTRCLYLLEDGRLRPAPALFAPLAPDCRPDGELPAITP